MLFAALKGKALATISSIRVGVVAQTDDEVYVLNTIKIYSYRAGEMDFKVEGLWNI